MDVPVENSRPGAERLPFFQKVNLQRCGISPRLRKPEERYRQHRKRGYRGFFRVQLLLRIPQRLVKLVRPLRLRLQRLWRITFLISSPS